MTQAVSGRLDAQASAALGKRLGDAEWLAALRKEAARGADALAMPTRAERPWKYYDISGETFDGYAPAGASGRSAEDLQQEYGPGGATQELFLEDNGEALLHSTADDRLVAPFNTLTDRELAVVRERAASAIPWTRNKLTALHYAFLKGGALVNVPANAEVADPVRLIHVATGDHTLTTPHTVIVTGANSRVKVIEDYRSSDDDIVAMPVVEIFPGEGSVVEYTSLHRWGMNTRVFTEQRSITGRDSELTSLTLATGAKALKYHIESSLQGRGSKSTMLGLSTGADSQHHNFYTMQDHIGQDTVSDLLIKSALEDHSQAVYYGVTRVGLEARRSDANQQNRNLLLSKTAKADSDPVLEILTNDVIKCAHGATAGPVDEGQLFYLQTRGLDREAAEDLLVWAFLGQVLDRVPDEALREELAAGVRQNLRKLS